MGNARRDKQVRLSHIFIHLAVLFLLKTNANIKLVGNAHKMLQLLFTNSISEVMMRLIKRHPNIPLRKNNNLSNHIYCFPFLIVNKRGCMQSIAVEKKTLCNGSIGCLFEYGRGTNLVRSHEYWFIILTYFFQELY